MSEIDKPVSDALNKVRADINEFERKYEREPGSVELLAVSKRKPATAIAEARRAGQLAFGENYAQEGIEKQQILQLPDLQWHFIGAIQSRKTAQIALHYDWVHGIDRAKIARRLSEQRPADLPPLKVCIQVNLDLEDGKAGVSLPEVHELAEQCAELDRIELRGLMAIPMPQSGLEQQRHSFARLRRCRDSLLDKFPQMTTLSMGMSADMEAAIAEGSTLVRVGTSIFGSRE